MKEILKDFSTNVDKTGFYLRKIERIDRTKKTDFERIKEDLQKINNKIKYYRSLALEKLELLNSFETALHWVEITKLYSTLIDFENRRIEIISRNLINKTTKETEKENS